MADKKILAVIGSTGAQGGGLAGQNAGIRRAFDEKCFREPVHPLSCLQV